jgi:FixJ family two-component response regulator
MASEQSLVALVDDDPSIRQALKRLFRTAGMKFVAFESAEESLESNLLNSAGCLIADVRMPRMQGLELQQVCREKWPTLPTIIISAFNDEQAEARAIKGGAIAFLHKPFDPMALLELVRGVLDVQNGKKRSASSLGDRHLDGQSSVSGATRKRGPRDRREGPKRS